jgi:hypothetical protein
MLLKMFSKNSIPVKEYSNSRYQSENTFNLLKYSTFPLSRPFYLRGFCWCFSSLITRISCFRTTVIKSSLGRSVLCSAIIIFEFFCYSFPLFFPGILQ